MRRTQALHPAALLVHQNGRLPADVSRNVEQVLHLLGVLMFRLKMIRPQGGASRRNARSLADIVKPANPVMNARAAIGAD